MERFHGGTDIDCLPSPVLPLVGKNPYGRDF